jgi:hypothetical protein
MLSGRTSQAKPLDLWPMPHHRTIFNAAIKTDR